MGVACGRGQGSSSGSPASPAGAVIGSRREWREGKEKGLGKLLLFRFGFFFAVFILCCTRKVVSDSGEKDSKFGGEKALGVRDCAPGVLGALRLVTFEVLTCFWWEKVCLHVGLMLSPCVSSPIVQPSGRVCRGSSAPPSPTQPHTPPSHFFLCFSPPLCLRVQSMHG